MASKLKDSLARQLRLPTKGIMGWITTRYLVSRNSILEKNAARLCNIQPHHHVLEVGFGPGIGLQHALQYVQDGPGKVYGVDLSSYMVETASSRLRQSIHNNKLELMFGSVEALPYDNDVFDCVFHCNCYYFWPSMQQALQELCRVMKPGAVMVTLLNLDSIKVAQSRGLLKYGHPDPVNYMCALELTGFKDVKMEYFTDSLLKYQAIFAHLPDQPADQSDHQELTEAKDSVDSTHGASSRTNDGGDVPPRVTSTTP